MFKNLIDTAVDFKGIVLRNIPSIVVSENLLDDLSSDPKKRVFGEALVMEQQEAGDFNLPVIDRPFTYGAALGETVFPTRFSDGRRYGVWYGSLDLLTTVYETVYHFRKRITDISEDIKGEVISERRVFQVQAGGIILDLRGKSRGFPELVHRRDYTFTHALGSYLYEQGQNGLLVESARHSEGTNFAAFKPDILSNPRHHSYLIYHWIPGDPEVRIEKNRGKVWKVLRVSSLSD